MDAPDIRSVEPDLVFATAISPDLLETASVAEPSGLVTADADTLTLDEQVALLAAHRVEIETASLRTELELVRAELAALKDVREAEAKQREAEELERQAAEAHTKLIEERVAAVAAVSPQLEATDARKSAWGSYSEEVFASYLADLKELTPKPAESAPVLETALKRTPAPIPAGGSATSSFLRSMGR